ncbi:hypothetical protein F5Y10DRAFT_73878 [Nemania abortiva]|nr:hypothetical protein F5Y10DRAFT_73878 [Nemania abortiva]
MEPFTLFLPISSREGIKIDSHKVGIFKSYEFPVPSVRTLLCLFYLNFVVSPPFLRQYYRAKGFPARDSSIRHAGDKPNLISDRVEVEAINSSSAFSTCWHIAHFSLHRIISRPKWKQPSGLLDGPVNLILLILPAYYSPYMSFPEDFPLLSVTTSVLSVHEIALRVLVLLLFLESARSPLKRISAPGCLAVQPLDRYSAFWVPAQRTDQCFTAPRTCLGDPILEPRIHEVRGTGTCLGTSAQLEPGTAQSRPAGATCISSQLLFDVDYPVYKHTRP